MIIGTNSTPTGIPGLWCGNFIQHRAAQFWHGSAVKQPWRQDPLQPDSFALFRIGPLGPVLVCSILLWQYLFNVSAPARETSLEGKGKVHSQSQTGADLYRQKSPPLVPDWSILMQMRKPNSWNLVQKALSWLVKMGALWLVREDVDGDIAVQLWLNGGKPQSY